MNQYTAPEFELDAFNCPYCGAFGVQKWSAMYPNGRGIPNTLSNTTSNLPRQPHYEVYTALCAKCRNYSLWHRKKMIDPASGAAPPPHSDLPEEIKADYEEARSIVSQSPRGATALLRLVLQKLCKHLGEAGKDINEDIKSLVKKGLDVHIQRSLDAVRVIGNEAVHPGVMNLNDDIETATALFSLVNFVVQQMITQRDEIDRIYNSLPSGKLDGIVQRDSKP